MTNSCNKLCLVQPSNEYQISVHKHALALTFPYLIKLLSLHDRWQLCLYVEDKSDVSFKELLLKEKPNFVWITANTATFPNAIKLANIAKEHNCFVMLGGVFASINAEIISNNYNCFDKIIKGFPDIKMLEKLPQEKIIDGKRQYDINFRLSDILNMPLFDLYRNDPVCYEITFGCVYNCNFCSLRRMWDAGICSKRSSDIINYDLSRLKNRNSLKIIDDDILQSQDVLLKCNFGQNFKKIVAETRIDRINEKSISILKELGVTHLIMGVETFDKNNLISSSKTTSKDWMKRTFNAIDLCNKYQIIARPVLQILYPKMPKTYLRDIEPYIKDWTPHNKIELFFSFFTPHPGLEISKGISKNLITNDLSKFDHLNPVYMPDGYSINDVNNVMSNYNTLVDITESIKYNPHIYTTGGYIKEFDVFF